MFDRLVMHSPDKTGYHFPHLTQLRAEREPEQDLIGLFRCQSFQNYFRPNT